MSVNIESMIAWMEARRGKVTYSMDRRDGPHSFDCSSSVYYAMMEAGAVSAGWAVNTEYMHDWLVKNGYRLICENGRFDARRGDVFIWGKRGQSSGAGGHTGIFVDGNHIIHCNYARNGISVDHYLTTAARSGNMYYYIYRKDSAVTQTVAKQESKPVPIAKTKTANKGAIEYEEHGTFTVTDPEGIYFRNGSSLSHPIQGIYNAGESVVYDRVRVDYSGYVWISWISARAGVRRWMPIRERKNGKSLPAWGTIV